jgi:hypothetical protein
VTSGKRSHDCSPTLFSIVARLQRGLEMLARIVASQAGRVICGVGFRQPLDAAIAGRVPNALHNQLCIAIAECMYAARAVCSVPHAAMAFYNLGARLQRLLWASTGTKDLNASNVLYVKALAAPFTVSTMP